MKKYNVELELGCFAQVTLVNPIMGDVMTKLLRKGCVPAAVLSDYLYDGYSITKVKPLTLGEYLNARIQHTVDSLNDTYAERGRLRDDFRKGDLHFEAYMTALTITQELEVSDMRKLYRQMKRLQRLDIDCTVEEAIQLFDMVF